MPIVNFQRRITQIVIFLLILLMTFSPLFSTNVHSHQINNVLVSVNNNEIYVSTTVIPDSNFVESLSAGISKELIFYLDLFRVWNLWPNEFIKGSKIIRILKSDPIKRDFNVINIDNTQTVERKFKDIEGMLSWAFNITDYKIANIRDLEPGKYFIKVTVESNIKRLPPIIGYFLFFLSQSEFSVSKKSHIFTINP
ncbi:MAG: DUF4390 domain-containing protein [Thermodesulfovibrionales bacterium]|nr:DUF4390 domain-containing protein [Thermodesulfovibrionales bacterium]